MSDGVVWFKRDLRLRDLASEPKSHGGRLHVRTGEAVDAFNKWFALAQFGAVRRSNYRGGIWSPAPLACGVRASADAPGY